MRRIVRTECPDVLEKKGAEWTAHWVTRVAEDRSCDFHWPQFESQKLNHILEEPLGAMTQNHCAFCDGSFTESLRTIEHFKPKKSFPAEAFAWENLFPACDRCQGTKLESFDERLLKPDAEGYAFEDYFICDADSGQVLPNPAASEDDKARAETTILMYGLARKERCEARRKEWRGFVARRKCGEDVALDDFNYRFFLEACGD